MTPPLSTSRQRPTFDDRLARFKSAWSSRCLLRAVALASVVVVIDQLAKSLALRTLADGPVLLVGQAGFRLAFNTGAAFSLGTDSTSVLTVISLVAVVVLCAVSGVVSNRLLATAIALIIGGAAGNVIDRLFRQHDGAVVDFIDLGFWPVFNFADVAIVTGCGLLIWSSFRGGPDDAAS